MDTVFAVTLLAVIEEGTVAGAGRRLGITPGAVTLRIKALEREFRTSLVARAGRSIVPTAAALRLVRPLGDIINQTRDLGRIANERQAPSGEIRLGSIATASTGTLPGLVASVVRDFPRVDLRIEPGTSDELKSRVLVGMLDAAIIVEGSRPLLKSETFVPWFEEPMVLIVPPGGRTTDPVSLIGSQPFIRYDRRSIGGMLVDDWLRKNEIYVRERLELDSLEAIVAMVAAGVGVSIIPDWRGPRPEGAKVDTIELPGSALVRRVGLYSKRVSARQDLIDLLTPAFRKQRI